MSEHTPLTADFFEPPSPGTLSRALTRPPTPEYGQKKTMQVFPNRTLFSYFSLCERHSLILPRPRVPLHAYFIFYSLDFASHHTTQPIDDLLAG